MKSFFILSALAILFLSNSDCSKKKIAVAKYKGKLEIAAICMNYTISVLEGDATDVAGNWTNEMTNKSYENVFRLGNPCDFPANIKQGDEFYFSIDTTKGKDCAVCMAYYPTPPKVLSIKVVQ